MVTRREFLDTLAVSAAGVALTSTAKSYGQIMGANERLNFAVIGLNGRASAHLSSLKANKDAARISHVCDVESSILARFAADVQKEMGYAAAMAWVLLAIIAVLTLISFKLSEHWVYYETK